MDEAREIYELIHEGEPVIQKEVKLGGSGTEDVEIKIVSGADASEDDVEPRKRKCNELSVTSSKMMRKKKIRKNASNLCLEIL